MFRVELLYDYGFRRPKPENALILTILLLFFLPVCPQEDGEGQKSTETMNGEEEDETKKEEEGKTARKFRQDFRSQPLLSPPPPPPHGGNMPLFLVLLLFVRVHYTDHRS
jgi:hypothetical protein